MADILRMIVVLSALCGLSGFALSYLKMVTAPVIEEQVLTYVQGPAIAGVFTDIDNQPIADRKAFETEKGRVLVFPAMRDGKLVGVALEAKGKGYGGDVGVMVGFNVANDTLAGIGTTTLKETPGLGMRIAEPGFTGQFRGLAASVGLKSQGGSIDGISGATISSSGAVTAVNLHQGAVEGPAALPAGAWSVSHAGGHQLRQQRPGHGCGGHLRARALQHDHFHGARHHPQESAHRLLHRHRGLAGGGGGTAHAGLCLSALPAAGHLPAAHRGELHHPGPRRGLRRQERRGRLGGRRPGHRSGLHHVADLPGLAARDPAWASSWPP